jgi:hypothetical protein
MMATICQMQQAGPDSSTPAPAYRQTVLTVGPMGCPVKLTTAIDPDEIIGIPFASLNATTLAHHRPDIIVTPLLCAEFDIMDIADRLGSVGYRGALIAVTPPLPDTEAVTREIKSQYADLDLFLYAQSA